MTRERNIEVVSVTLEDDFASNYREGPPRRRKMRSLLKLRPCQKEERGSGEAEGEGEGEGGERERRREGGGREGERERERNRDR